ncbi:hypothetical protein QAD02_022392 [Eretmocerus hayati]|uniref:Uncharacterized protein n=1 Tax=Eretmocerus hayati TaxID=131215 RepID=A0ACC2PTZ8_9HYME|nr:hypothetical protein QAD02_022392 [Eretmocerus hayati]
MMTDFERQMRMAAVEDRRIRIAAESVINAPTSPPIRPNYLAYNPRAPDSFNEILIAGMRYNGRMSNVRRFFCLFVTFDFLFTILMWLICIVISGSDVQESFIKEIVHYNIKTSLFDVVVAGAVRFVILLTFYGLLHADHWCTVALSTSLTCGFLISKVFLYDWTQSKQPVFEVFLILTSFVLVWSEIWFLDIKVIPQETLVREWFLGYANPERAPLLSSNLISPAIATENIASFYTPLDSPDQSDDENIVIRKNQGSNEQLSPTTITMKLPQDKIDEYKKQGENSVDKCYNLVCSDKWKNEKSNSHGDVIHSQTLPKPDGKIFKATATFDITAEKLSDFLQKKVDESVSWNKQTSEAKIIYVENDEHDIAYQATNTLANGAISPRDFIVWRYITRRGPYFMHGGYSVELPDVPPKKGYVRAEARLGGGYAIRDLPSEDGKEKCEFQWILNTDMKGWIPQRVIDMFSPEGMLEFLANLRDFLRTWKD